MTHLTAAKLRPQAASRVLEPPRHFTPSSNVRILTLRCRGLYRKPKLRVSPDICDFTTRFRLKETSTSCSCIGTLISPDNASVTAYDQLLMMLTIGLTYISGVVVPSNKPPAPSPSSSGSTVASDEEMNVEVVWDQVRTKLLGALHAVQRDANLDNQKYVGKGPLSLSAIAQCPKLRLLSATLHALQQEVNNISVNPQSIDRGDWLATSSETIRISSQSVFVNWLEEELILENKKHNKDFLLTMMKRLKRDDTILKNIRKSGKEDLYADLLFFLRFRFLGMGCCYDSKLLSHHGVDILEDLIIAQADGITANYLELISVDSNMSNEMNGLGLDLCSLSTRALQKLRNEMALKQWLHQNVESVVSMYEDRFDLYSFQMQQINETEKNPQFKLDWWKKFALHNAASTFSPLQYMVISPLPMSVKRTKELRDLSGWRYYFSLYLEFSDITMPFLRIIIAKVCSAISFLLVTLVGRSLGLIYSGIRQSLGWR